MRPDTDHKAHAAAKQQRRMESAEPQTFLFWLEAKTEEGDGLDHPTGRLVSFASPHAQALAEGEKLANALRPHAPQEVDETALTDDDFPVVINLAVELEGPDYHETVAEFEVGTSSADESVDIINTLTNIALPMIRHLL